MLQALLYGSLSEAHLYSRPDSTHKSVDTQEKLLKRSPAPHPSDVLPRNWYLPFSPSYISDQNLTYFLLFLFLFKSDIRFSSFSSHHPAVSHNDGRRPTCQREHPSLVRTNSFLTLDVGFFVFDSFPGFSVQHCDLPGETL